MLTPNKQQLGIYARTIGLTVVVFLIAALTTTEDEPNIVSVNDFKAYIDPIGLQFSMPEGYKEAPVFENRDLWFAFAMKDTNADFEVRYSVWPLKPALEDYKKCQQDTNCVMVHPNVFYRGRIQSNVLNMTGGRSMMSDAFPKDAVKREFNADVGGSAFFEFSCGFGKGYAFGQAVYLHKDNVADVIITFMSNDKKTHSELMMKSFHALSFQ